MIDSELGVEGEDESGIDAGADRVVILYGSETGTAEGFARQAARRLSRYRPRVMALDEYDKTELRRETLALFVTSTFGGGEMPGNGKAFLNWVQEQPGGSLDGLNFAVMALGSTVYPQFCAAGAVLDKELARAGASRALTLHKGDEIKGQSDTFRQWLDLVARLLGEDPTSGSASAAAHQTRLKVSFVEDGQTVGANGTAGTGARKSPGVPANVVENRELLKEVVLGSRSTRFLAFDLANTGLTYETGDHVAIYPQNPAPEVERLCGLLNINPDALFTTSLVNGMGATVEGETAYPTAVRVRQALTEDLDITLREPYGELIAALAHATQDAKDKERLQTWAHTLRLGDDDENCLALKKHMGDNFVTVADLLDAFQGAAPGLEILLDILPKHKPRLYSISSCSLAHPQQIHVTVGVLQITTDAGKTRPGLCSNYLAQLDPAQGATVRLAVHTSQFRPPVDVSAPLILVGPGTGLSPLIGFLQHREIQLRQLRDQTPRMNVASVEGEPVSDPSLLIGSTRLYFGCRNLNDYLYQQELEAWKAGGVLHHLEVAFSRLGEQKNYVQHLIGQKGSDVWEALKQPDCHYYVCGDAKMADEVFETLMNVVKTEGGLSHAEAVDFFRQMQEENRYVMDVWGVLLNFQKALADVQDAKYSQGERWLKRISSDAAPLAAV